MALVGAGARTFTSRLATVLEKGLSMVRVMERLVPDYSRASQWAPESAVGLLCELVLIR
jgi:hypothetical protein